MYTSKDSFYYRNIYLDKYSYGFFGYTLGDFFPFSCVFIFDLGKKNTEKKEEVGRFRTTTNSAFDIDK